MREREKNGVYSDSLWALGILFSSPATITSGFQVAFNPCTTVLTFGFQVISSSGQGMLEEEKIYKLTTGSVGHLILIFLPDPPAHVYFSEFS